MLKKPFLLLSIISVAGFTGILTAWPLFKADSDLTYSEKIDAIIESKITGTGRQPGRITSDAEFIRRVYLDITGTIPEAQDVEAFINLRSPNKRAALIYDLLNSRQYAEYWTDIWAARLIGKNRPDPRVNRMALRQWIHQAIKENMPYDKLAEALISAKGRSDQNGAVNYLIHLELQPLEIAGSVSRIFMGQPLECAQCHDHPTENWTQKDYYGMAAFFTQLKPQRPTPRMRMMFKQEKEAGKIKGPLPVTVEEGAITPLSLEDNTGRLDITPRFLDGRVPKTGEWDYRKAFTEFMTSTASKTFAKNMVNVTWSRFFGRGLVEPLDGLVATNPATHPELLDYLAATIIEHDYDPRFLIRVIANTRAYQRSAVIDEGDAGINAYARARVRPLSSTQTVYALLQATGAEGILKSMNQENIIKIKQGLLTHFGFAFNNDEREESERFYGTIPQALMMMNGRLTEGGSTAHPRNNLGNILKRYSEHRDRIYWIYMTVLSRPPTEEELFYTDNLAPGFRSPAAREGYEDLFWALLNSPEFSTNH